MNQFDDTKSISKAYGEIIVHPNTHAFCVTIISQSCIRTYGCKWATHMKRSAGIYLSQCVSGKRFPGRLLTQRGFRSEHNTLISILPYITVRMSTQRREKTPRIRPGVFSLNIGLQLIVLSYSCGGKSKSYIFKSRLRKSGSWFNIKITPYRHRKSHCGDKTILRPSYLHNRIS